MKSMLNSNHIEGVLYEHKLERKVTGEKSKNPNTPYITGTVRIATDDKRTNVVEVHFSYVTELTKSKAPNATYTILNKIINGELGSVMGGSENPVKLRIDTAISLNEWYTERDGVMTLVSTMRNEGGFVHQIPELNEDENKRNEFKCDMVITNVRTLEADEEKELPERAILKGYIFDFRKTPMPIELSVVNPNAITYFESLGASGTEPVFTQIRGRQISSTVMVTKVEESAFDGPSVTKTPRTRKDWVVTWAQKEPYVWDSEDSITAIELKEGLANREVELATLKENAINYRANKNQAAAPAAPGAFQF